MLRINPLEIQFTPYQIYLGLLWGVAVISAASGKRSILWGALAVNGFYAWRAYTHPDRDLLLAVVITNIIGLLLVVALLSVPEERRLYIPRNLLVVTALVSAGILAFLLAARGI